MEIVEPATDMKEPLIDLHPVPVSSNPELSTGLPPQAIRDLGSQANAVERPSCAVETTINIIGGRWKVLILRELMSGVKRFNELHRTLHGITQKMLTQQLREMAADGIVHREVYLQVPPKVEYSLTELGQSLEPILSVMHEWGVKYGQEQKK
jgi:DNA-binding HxlR family transcriptional regulator